MKWTIILIISFALTALLSCEDLITNPSSDLVELCYLKLDDNSNWQIYTNSRSGTNPQNISNNSNNDAYSPLWSPNGQCIAFRYERGESSGCDVYLYDVGSNEKINITSGLTSIESATPELWSPDCRQLLYYYHKIGETYYYYIMNSDGTDKRELFESESVNIISFCDEGGSILYTRDQLLCKTNITSITTDIRLDFHTISNNSIYVDGYNHNTNTILCHEDSTRWNGGGTFLIEKIDLTTIEQDTIVTAENNFRILRPVFSNDYSKIVYIEIDYGNNISKIILLENGKKIELNRLTSEDELYGFYEIEFSANDCHIIYTVSLSTGGETASFESYTHILNISTIESSLVSKGCDPHWNPLNNF